MAKPLLKRKPDGSLYTRRRSIEALIDSSLQLDLGLILDRADLRDSKSAGYIPSECLVHLIREFRRRGNEVAVNKLLPKLLARCGRIFLKATAPGYVPDIEELKQQVLGRLAELFAEDGAQEKSSVLDFYEVSFGLAFRTLRVSLSREEHARTEPLLELVEKDEQGEELSETEAFDRTTAKFTDLSLLQDATVRLELAQALAKLPPKQRQVIVLHHYYGYEIESSDSTSRTVAKICGVTGRTVRNWLREATTNLEVLMEKKR